MNEDIKTNVIGLLDDSGYEISNRVYDCEGISPTLNTMGGGNRQPKIFIKQATKSGFIECEAGGVADLSYPTSNKRRGRVQGGGDDFTNDNGGG